MTTSYTIDLTGKNALVFGVANHRSIAWAIAQKLHEAGATVGFSHANAKLGQTIDGLVNDWDTKPFNVPCDVTDDAQIADAFMKARDAYSGKIDMFVHSIAYAEREDLGAHPFSETQRANYMKALDVSAYSLLPLAHQAALLMPDGGSMLTMTFQASQRVFPGYNVMAVAKGALETSMRYLAEEYGSRNIRVNALSAGPVQTLSARAIAGYKDFERLHAATSPMGRAQTVEEVGAAALFLLSPMSSGVTGTTLYVDTGYHIMGGTGAPQ